ncbi:MAG TPA: ACT domain-containing protein [Deltaproteobacteria bacterium]|nr:ACT domain-containing protein [Deltaproteobacteria bacterium]OQC22692.1 MAG: acetolactate synthase 3 regulatory subunit [Deltaproteobacteria bacterium ADurb.Bin072]HRW80355.1 ACT domain-containing protein [Desulfomonilia bacterium]NMD40206.1 ACT domain-containing protein [Deltaproteobacteria bacterium]HNQ85749.1 ACT domain-containing protein [Deltaproteobacteria bacterium]
MKVEQISIFLENKPGGLSGVTRVLKDAGINIRALSLADTSDFGILRLIVDDVNRAKKVLNDNGFAVGRTHVIAVEVPDRPGGLHSILDILTRNGINVEYMYAFVERSGENAVIIFRFDNIDHAIEVLISNGFTVLKGEQVYNL